LRDARPRAIDLENALAAPRRSIVFVLRATPRRIRCNRCLRIYGWGGHLARPSATRKIV